ncbi:frpC [Symbiodinium microadriaticum]|nr:frpC [Symbiodinium microadriaticum]
MALHQASRKKDKDLDGTDGDDVIIGTDKNDKIDGKGGNDEIQGLAGNDKLDGSDGNDSLVGGDGNDDLDGGKGNDLLEGGAGNDKLEGKRGDDELVGGSGNDKLKGDKGNDILNGGEGHDDLDGDDGNDVLQGGAGKDKLDGGDGNDSLSGGDGKDHLKGKDGNDILDGGDGNDDLKGGKGDDILSGGAGKDDLKGEDGDDVLEGGTGKDDIKGGKGDDLFVWNAGDGEDKLDGGKGNDSIVITTSDVEQQVVTIDTNKKGNIVVSLDGSEGAELELKNIEDFSLVYGEGGVELNIGDGAGDIFGDDPLPVSGGEGSDVIDVADSNVPVSVDAGTGDDEVTGGNANDEISGGEGNDVISGGGGDDIIDAGVGDDRVLWKAGDGNDTIDGGEGFDELDLSLDENTLSNLTVSADANGNVILVSDDGTQLTVDGVEDIVFKAGAAGTAITIGDLTGTDIAQDTLFFVGAIGDDVFDASATDRRIDARGNGGNDQLFSGSANDFLDGGAGDDILDAGSGSGSDVVRGGSGNDLIRLTIGDDLNSGTADDLDGGADNDQLDLTFVETTDFDLVLRVESNGDGSFRVIGDDLGSSDDETANISNVETLKIIAGEGALNFELGSLADTSLASNGVIFEGSADDDFFNGANTDVHLTLSGGAGNNFLAGGSADDVLEGGVGNDSLQGNDGDDFLTGSTGNDVLNGGAGFDTLSYSNATAAITLDLNITGVQNTGSSGDDSLINIERIEGSSFDDTIVGNSLDNVLVGGDGDDVLSGGDGFDILVGGAGNDTLTDSGFNNPLIGGAGDDFIDGVASYSSDPGGIIANFSDSAVVVGSETVAARSALDGYGDTDTFSVTARNLGGSAFADHVVGSDTVNGWFLRGGDDEAYGMEGDDFIMGGSGDDLIDGGEGFDTVQYQEDGLDSNGAPTQGINVNLATKSAVDGFGDTDTLLNVEAVSGSELNDVITGDGVANKLEGHGGNDTIDGSGGDDVLLGGAGDDTLTGGADSDRFEFTVINEFGVPQFGTDTITDFDVSQDVLDFTPFDSLSNLSDVQAIASDDGSNTSISISGAGTVVLQGVLVADLVSSNFEFANPSGGPIVGTEGDDTLDGTSEADVIQGLGGDDILRGLAGDDQLEGGAGNDRLRGFDGNDLLIGGDDFDAVDYSEDIAGVTIDLSSQSAVDGWGDTDSFIDIENAYGSAFADVITGDASSNFVWGGDGNDIIDGNGGNDELFGEDGDDTLIAGPAASGLIWLHGGPGNDILTGTASGGGIEILLGGPGDDTISDPGGFFSVLNGGSGNDFLDGFVSHLGHPNGVIANLSDSVWNIAGETVQARTGIDGYGDTDTFGPGVIRIRGSEHDDFLQGSAFGQTIQGNDGDDLINGMGGDDFIQPGPGNDIVNGGNGFDNIAFNETNVGGKVANHGAIVNLGTTDFSYGSEVPGIVAGIALANTAVDQFDDPAGVRSIDTVAEIEAVVGSAFSDVIIGGDEHNFLEGRDGDDQIYGGNVEGDNLVGGPGNDYLDGQGGDWDTAWYRMFDGSGGGVTVDLSNNIATEDGFGGQGAVVSLAATPDANGFVTVSNNGFGGTALIKNFEALRGTDHDDHFTGDDNDNEFEGFVGNDTLIGGGGHDRLRGQDGDDYLQGDAGNDELDGGENNDTLIGGSGSDIFRFVRKKYDGSLVSFGEDTVEDFAINEDILDLNEIPQFTGLDALLAASTDVGNDAVISFETVDQGITETNSITLKNISVSDFQNMEIWFASIQGTEGDDVLNGTEFGERMEGLGGNDTLNGLGGDDRLEGGDGDDVLNGGAGDDNFEDGPGNDQVFGGAGSDFINASPGDDIFNGGEDWDTVSFRWWHEPSAGVEVDLSLGTNQVIDDGFGGTDTLVDIESVQGSNVADSLTGDALDNNFRGEDGDDVIDAAAGNDYIVGGPGNDTLDGGAGFDTAAFPHWADTNQAIDIDLANNVANNDGFGDVDTLLNFEDIQGSQFDDLIRGDSQENNLRGEDGNDTIVPRGGNDYVRGGNGADTFVYADSDGNLQFDTIADFEPGIDQVDLQNVGSITDFTELGAAATENGSDLRIDLGNDNVLELINIGLADLSSSDFLF